MEHDLRELASKELTAIHHTAELMLFREGGECPAVLHVLSAIPDEPVTVHLVGVDAFMRSDEGKDKLGEKIRILIDDPSVSLVFVVAEGWKVEVAKTAPLTAFAPAEHPDRVECLLVSILSKVGAALVAMDIDRAAKKLAAPGPLTGLFGEVTERTLTGRFTKHPDRGDETLH